MSPLRTNCIFTKRKVRTTNTHIWSSCWLLRISDNPIQHILRGLLCRITPQFISFGSNRIILIYQTCGFPSSPRSMTQLTFQAMKSKVRLFNPSTIRREPRSSDGYCSVEPAEQVLPPLPASPAPRVTTQTCPSLQLKIAHHPIQCLMTHLRLLVVLRAFVRLLYLSPLRSPPRVLDPLSVGEVAGQLVGHNPKVMALTLL